MRTTVTLADDVAAGVRQRRRETRAGLSEAVNDLVRAGLLHRERPTAPWVMPTADLGEPLIDISNVAEALEILEGPDHR